MLPIFFMPLHCSTRRAQRLFEDDVLALLNSARQGRTQPRYAATWVVLWGPV
jgi:hypothetical protein